ASSDPTCAIFARHAMPHLPLGVRSTLDELTAAAAPMTLDVEPPSASPAAALLAVYRGDFETARQIAEALPPDADAQGLVRIIDLRSGHPRGSTPSTEPLGALSQSFSVANRE